uniref:EF-hand domain-containing protein n=1 Tax=Caenorhabditis tropicalis TaxID=1561998 RepID=A0A1I7UFY5_9PELO
MARPNSPEVDFSREEIRSGLLSEGISENGAAEITDFLFKDRSEDITPGELKQEFREFLSMLSIEDKQSIKRIINNELERFFSEQADDNHTIFLVG